MCTAKQRNFTDNFGPDHHVANVRYLIRELGDLPAVLDVLAEALPKGLTIDQILPLCLEAVDAADITPADDWHWHNRHRSAKYQRCDSLAALVGRDHAEAEEALSVVNERLASLDEQKRAIVAQMRDLHIEQDRLRDTKKLCKLRFLKIISVETGRYKKDREFAEMIRKLLA